MANLFRGRKPRSLPGGVSREERLHYKSQKGMARPKQKKKAIVFPRATTPAEYEPVRKALLKNFMKTKKKRWITKRKMAFDQIVNEAKAFENYPDILMILANISRKAFFSEAFQKRTLLQTLIFDPRYFPENLIVPFKMEDGKVIKSTELVKRLLQRNPATRNQLKKEIPLMRRQIEQAKKKLGKLFYSAESIVNYPQLSSVFRHNLMEQLNPSFIEAIDEIERLINQ